MSTERDWKGAYEEECKTVDMVWAALGCKSYDDSKPFTIWEHVEKIKAERDKLQRQRDALLAAAKNFRASVLEHDPEISISAASGLAFVALVCATEEAEK